MEAKMQEGRPPTFVHIGGQRCGTTWMYQCLSEHPEIYTATPKELNYFNSKYELGDKWYFSHFKPDPKHKTWGEATPLYLSWISGGESAASRLAETVPNCKIVCCLRNPVDRAYSQWKYWGEGRDPFRKAVENNYVNILGRGLYASHLKRWFDYFPRESFLIQIHDDLVSDNAAAVSEVYNHLNVDSSYRPSWVGQAYNSVVLPRTQTLLRRVGLGRVVKAVRGTSVGTYIRRYIHASKKKDKAAHNNMDPDLRRDLEDYYLQPSQELEELLGIDLGHWLDK